METKNKQIILTIVGVVILVVGLVGLTYAFFNYTRTGATNTIRVGRISFVSQNEQTITLTNLFPIDPTETGIMNDSTKVGTYSIDISGDTDYVNGIEYLVSIQDANIYTNQNQLVPISVDVTVTDLGTSNANYFTARESASTSIYKQLVGDTLVGDGMLLVGFIAPNATPGTASGIDGNITIKAYLDENKILISDTYGNGGMPESLGEGKTIITTNEWNALESSGLSFKVKVEANEGIWVKGSLEEIMKVQNLNTTTQEPIRDDQQSTYVTGANGIDFGEVSRDTNGKGVYMRAGTQNDTYPIMYYRGEVTDNNVMFNDKCWKAVRTTDTGGVKLIYNGEKSPKYSQEFTDPDTYATEHEKDIFTFDSTDSTWNYEVDDGLNHEITFKVPAGENYDIVIAGTTGSTCGGSVQIYKDEEIITGVGNGGGNPINLNYTYGTLTSSNIIKVLIFETSTTSSSCSVNVKINMQQNTAKLSQDDYSLLAEKASGEYGCEKTGTDIFIDVNGSKLTKFSGNNLNNSPTYVGYMWGTVYPYSSSDWTSNVKFGSGFIWDGSNYKLTDATETTPNDTHHYSCNRIDAEETCASIRYVYLLSGNTKYYITISDGKGIEEALQDMQVNTTSSNAKTQIDTWYANNMNTVINKLEDTIWCNDRSIARYNGWLATGMINGSDVKNYSLLFGTHERSNYAIETSTMKNQPSLVCVNKNDAFTVSNGNGNRKLTYPVALLTEDEIVLAGGLAGSSSTFYLNNGNTHYWSLSPSHFSNYNAREFIVGYGYINDNSVNNEHGLRPAISIKPGLPVVSGTGTAQDPYIIE